MPHVVDIHVGKRIRHCRWMIGMTQQKLAEKVGTKFQQIQKYEIGANRVSASRLWDIATALDVPVHFFFEGLTRLNGHRKAGKAEESQIDLLNDKEALELIRFFRAIPEDQRQRLFDLACSLTERR